MAKIGHFWWYTILMPFFQLFRSAFFLPLLCYIVHQHKLCNCDMSNFVCCWGGFALQWVVLVT